MRDTLNLFARRFALALQSSTRVRPSGPLSAPDAPEAELVRTSTAHVPGVGWLVGIAACLVFAIVSLALGHGTWAPAAAAVACTLATVLLTGARHESALFAMAERLHTPAGTRTSAGFGTLALVLLLPAKFVLLASLASTAEAAVMSALFAAHVVSRFALVVTHWAASTDTDTGSLRVGVLWCVVPLALMAVAGGLAFLLVALALGALAAFAVLRFCRAHPDATPEERQGTVQQVCEVGFYLGAAIAA